MTYSYFVCSVITAHNLTLKRDDWNMSVYRTLVPRRRVDHNHEISTFQHVHSDNTLQTVIKCILAFSLVNLHAQNSRIADRSCLRSLRRMLTVEKCGRLSQLSGLLVLGSDPRPWSRGVSRTKKSWSWEKRLGLGLERKVLRISTTFATYYY